MNTKFLDKIIDKLIDETIINEPLEFSGEPEFIYSWNSFHPPHMPPWSLKSRHFSQFYKHLITIYGINTNSESLYILKNYIKEMNDRYPRPNKISENIDKSPNDYLLKEQITLSNKDKEFMFRTYKEMGIDDEWAEYDLSELLKWLNNLPETITLYRLLYIDDDNVINREELGDHYTQEKKDLLHNHHSHGSIYGGHWGHPILITVEVDKDQINLFNTIHNNILYPHEQEITLKNKGRGVKIIKLEKLSEM